jgi:hypothetical protein
MDPSEARNMRLAPAFQAALLIAALSATAVGSVPQTISYQGVLRDAMGNTVPDGNYSITFSLYDVETGGSALWSETQSLFVEDCVLNAILGSVTPLSLPFNVGYWLGVSVDGGAELTPRVRLTGSPYAFTAVDVETDVVSSVEGVVNDEGDIDLVEGPNITIVPDDIANTITIAATGGGDITSVGAGEGLGGGGEAGAVSLTVNTGPGLELSMDAVQLTGPYQDGSAYSGVFAPTAHDHDADYINDDAGEINQAGDFGFTTAPHIANLNADLLDGFDSSEIAAANHNHDAQYINDEAGEINSASDFAFTTAPHIANLNADLLDGRHASSFADSFHLHPIYSDTSHNHDSRYVNEGQPNSVTSWMIVPDVVSSVDGVSNDAGDIDLVAGSNITITPDDGANTITIAAAGGDDGDWVIDGDDIYRLSGKVGIGAEAGVATMLRVRADSVLQQTAVVGDARLSWGSTGGYFSGSEYGVEARGEQNDPWDEWTTYTGVKGSASCYEPTNTCYGVYGSAIGPWENYGVYGYAAGGSEANYAGYFAGDGRFTGDVEIDGYVGIGTAYTSARLSVHGGDLRITDGDLYVKYASSSDTIFRVRSLTEATEVKRLDTERLQLRTDATAGHVLTCDNVFGEAVWMPPATPSFLVDRHNESATTTIGSSVTQYDDTQVTLAVPGAGYIVVTSTVWCLIAHTTGITDRLYLGHGTSPTSLGDIYARMVWEVPSGHPSASTIQHTFSVHSTHYVSAGTHTYYLTGRMDLGQDANDRFWYAQMTAVYYPTGSKGQVDLPTAEEIERIKAKEALLGG